MNLRIAFATLAIFLSVNLGYSAEDEGVALETQLIRLPAPLALEMIISNGERMVDGDALLARSSELITAGKAELLDRRILRGEPGLRIREVDAVAHSFATEYDVDGGARGADFVGIAEEQRQVGTIVNASVSPSGQGAVDVTLEFERHLDPAAERPLSYPKGNRSVELKATQPEFHYHSLSSNYTTIPGRATLVAAVSPVRIDAKQQGAFVDLLFATVAGTVPADAIETGSSEIVMLVISVTDALGAKVEAQQKADSDLLAQLVDAVGVGKATLEAVTHNHRSLNGQCNDPVRSVLECRLPTAVDLSTGGGAAVPVSIEPFALGISSGAYVERRQAGVRVPWRLGLDLERLRATRDRDATDIAYGGANLRLEGVIELVGDSATVLVDVSTRTVGESRRYFTFLRVKTK